MSFGLVQISLGLAALGFDFAMLQLHLDSWLLALGISLVAVITKLVLVFNRKTKTVRPKLILLIINCSNALLILNGKKKNTLFLENQHIQLSLTYVCKDM